MTENETFEGSYPFKPHWIEFDFGRLHYVDEGRGEKTILLLHGEPSWSYLYRDIVRKLSKTYRVIAPDMMGFGKSDCPETFDYAPASQVACLIGLLEALDLSATTLVCHDWGGPIGSAAALLQPHRFNAIIGLNTGLSVGLPEEFAALGDFMAHSPYFQWMTKLHADGTLDTVLGELDVIVPAIMKGLQGFRAPITSQLLEAYSAPFKRERGCLGATALPRAMVDGSAIPSQPNPDALRAFQSIPAMLIYGLEDKVLPADRFIPAFLAIFPDAPVYEIEKAGHFLQEDAPETVALLIQQFVQSLP